MPFSTPTAGDVHVNVPLTNFAQKYLQDQMNFIATRAMPMLPVTKQSDQYYIFSRDDFYRDQAQIRADGTESQGGGFTLSSETYFSDVYAFHKLVTDRQRLNQDEVINLDQSATQYVMHKMLIRREREFQDTFVKASVWDTDFTPTTKWNAANSTPIEEIRTGKRTVMGNTGYMPNRMIMARDVYDTLLDNDAVLDRINGGATTALPALVQRQRLAEILELDEIFVMDAVYNSSLEGAASQSTQFVLTDGALLYYAPASVGPEEPSAGVAFNWTGMGGSSPAGTRIKRIRNEDKEADKIEAQMSFDHKVTGSELGYFFNDVLA